mgnify:CR=1 FL=1
MLVSKTKIVYLSYLFFIMAFSIRGCYLLPTEFSIFGLTLRIICLGINLGFCILVAYQYGVSLLIEKVDGWFLFSIVLAVIGTVMAYFSYNQPMISTFLIQMYIFSYTLLFIPIRKLIDRKIISYYDLKNLVYVFGIILLVLLCLQFFFRNNIQLLNVTVLERYGGARYYLDSSYIALLIAIAIGEIIKRKRIVFNSIIVLAGIFVEVNMIKSRAIMIALIFSLLITVLVVRQVSWKKVLISIICFAGAVYFFNYTEMGIDTISSIMEADTSLSIRQAARNFYLNKFWENPFWGSGYVDSYYSMSAKLSGQNQGFYYVDNGIWGILFYYGIIGILWSIGGIVPRIFESVKEARNNGEGFPIFYIIYICALLNTVQFDFFRARMGFTLYALLLYCINQRNEEDIRKVQMGDVR